MINKPTKPKKCKNCKKSFIPTKPMQAACSPKCALEIAVAQRKKKAAEKAKKERAEIRAAKLKVKTRAQHAKEAQAAFNAWVRERDYAEPCISCQRHHAGQYHAGHYLTVGARPELRFEPLNTHKQCSPCNLHLSGNLILYRVNLIKKIGIEKVEWLEGHHEPKRYTIEDLEEIKKTYRAKARELKKQRGA